MKEHPYDAPHPPQRSDISRKIREMNDAVAVDEVHHADALSQLRECRGAELVTQPLSFMLGYNELP